MDTPRADGSVLDRALGPNAPNRLRRSAGRRVCTRPARFSQSRACRNQLRARAQPTGRMAEQLAKALSAKRAAIPVWDAFYADLAAVFALRHQAQLLQGRRLLLSENGGLLRPVGPRPRPRPARVTRSSSYRPFGRASRTRRKCPRMRISRFRAPFRRSLPTPTRLCSGALLIPRLARAHSSRITASYGVSAGANSASCCAQSCRRRGTTSFTLQPWHSPTVSWVRASIRLNQSRRN